MNTGFLHKKSHKHFIFLKKIEKKSLRKSGKIIAQMCYCCDCFTECTVFWKEIYMYNKRCESSFICTVLLFIVKQGPKLSLRKSEKNAQISVSCLMTLFCGVPRLEFWMGELYWLKLNEWVRVSSYPSQDVPRHKNQLVPSSCTSLPIVRRCGNQPWWLSFSYKLVLFHFR